MTTEVFIAGTEPTEQCLDSDHYSPSVLDFSNNPVLVQQVEQEGNEVPPVEVPSDQPTYITPDPEVHAILTGEQPQSQTQPQ